MKISLEVVPRTQSTLIFSVNEALHFGQVDMFNFPDLVRFDVSSLVAAGYTRNRVGDTRSVVPHIRACDYELQKMESLIQTLQFLQMTEVLVIQGDATKHRPNYPTTTPQLVAELKKQLPYLRVYAGYDPYRDVQKERDHTQAKNDAGVSGFFTQPIFDSDVYSRVEDALRDQLVFIGVCPVIADSSVRYWAKQGITIGGDYALTLRHNVAWAKAVMRRARNYGHNVYLMPIKISVDAYLAMLFR